MDKINEYSGNVWVGKYKLNISTTECEEKNIIIIHCSIKLVDVKDKNTLEDIAIVNSMVIRKEKKGVVAPEGYGKTYHNTKLQQVKNCKEQYINEIEQKLEHLDTKISELCADSSKL